MRPLVAILLTVLAPSGCDSKNQVVQRCTAETEGKVCALPSGHEAQTGALGTCTEVPCTQGGMPPCFGCR